MQISNNSPKYKELMFTNLKETWYFKNLFHPKVHILKMLHLLEWWNLWIGWFSVAQSASWRIGIPEISKAKMAGLLRPFVDTEGLIDW